MPDWKSPGYAKVSSEKGEKPLPPLAGVERLMQRSPFRDRDTTEFAGNRACDGSHTYRDILEGEGRRTHSGELPPLRPPGLFPLSSDTAFGLGSAPKTLYIQWCPGTESNCRHEDFQSSALPTELPRQHFLKTLYVPPKKRRSEIIIKPTPCQLLSPSGDLGRNI